MQICAGLVAVIPQNSHEYNSGALPGLHKCFFSVVVFPHVLQVYTFFADIFFAALFFTEDFVAIDLLLCFKLVVGVPPG